MDEPSRSEEASGLRREFDQFLATVLRGGETCWPPHWRGVAIEDAFVKRILFHGVAGMLADGFGLGDWPDPIKAEIRRQSQAQAMWEMEHHQLLLGLLAAFDKQGIRNCLMKGTASAYQLYAKPHLRSRGDTDLLVASTDLAGARAILERFGLTAEDGIAEDVDIAFQESWLFNSRHGFIHLVDLHWQALNSASLKDILPAGECLAHRALVPSGPEGAYFLGVVRHLLHTCLHRGMHRSAPYFVDGDRYTDNDRLIWATDILLITSRLSDAQWSELATLATDRGVAEACAEALAFAKKTLGAPVPDDVLRAMASKSGEAGSDFILRQRRAGRAWRNFVSIPWYKKAAYLRRQILPPGELMRARYPQYRCMPLIFSYGRRGLELLPFLRRSP